MRSCLIAACVVAGSALATPVYADGPPAPGAGALARGRAAWDKGEADVAEAAYKEALEAGGLSPEETREGYVRLGSARAVLGKRDQALAAFRAAAVLDADFAVPPEAGKKAIPLAQQAKKDVAKIGTLSFTSSAPDKVEAAKPFKVKVQIDAAHVPVVSKVAVTARDGTGGKDFTTREAPRESMEIEIPASSVIAGALVTVRVDALDPRNNRIATSENRVQVASEGAVAPVPVPTDKPEGPQPSGNRKSFWSTPWPYVIGGVVIAGAGAAVFFGTRPTEDVTIGSPAVRAR